MPLFIAQSFKCHHMYKHTISPPPSPLSLSLSLSLGLVSLLSLYRRVSLSHLNIILFPLPFLFKLTWNSNLHFSILMVSLGMTYRASAASALILGFYGVGYITLL
jgi:hypothetical protein